MDENSPCLHLLARTIEKVCSQSIVDSGGDEMIEANESLGEDFRFGVLKACK